MLSLSFVTSSGHPVTLQSLLRLAELPSAWGPSEVGQVEDIQVIFVVALNLSRICRPAALQAGQSQIHRVGNLPGPAPCTLPETPFYSSFLKSSLLLTKYVQYRKLGKCRKLLRK